MNDLIVKICGVTRPEDARLAINLGADRIGIILYSKARRGVTLERAREIADATKQVGGIPVGVFVDSSAREITDCCQACEIQHIQLHGQDSGRLAKELSLDFSVTLSVGIDASGQVTSSGYKFLDQAQGTAEHLLFDYHEAGSGKQFDHTRFELPSHRSWILAGGLNAENVREAIRLLQPNGVDVSTGVESSQLGEKDPNRLRDFIKAARTL